MSTNIVYMIGEKRGGGIFDAQQDYFTGEAGFNSFFPSKWVAERFRTNELNDEGGRYYEIIEAKVLSYENGEIVVWYEPFGDAPPF